MSETTEVMASQRANCQPVSIDCILAVEADDAWTAGKQESQGNIGCF